jgi:hypothetical protein
MNEENKSASDKAKDTEISDSGSQSDFDWDKVEIDEEPTDDWTDENENQKPQPDTSKKEKRDFIIEMALFLILGILMGVSIKLEAVKRITIGFDDYKMKPYAQQVDINSLQEQAKNKAIEDAAKQAEQQGQSASDLSQPGGDEQ